MNTTSESAHADPAAGITKENCYRALAEVLASDTLKRSDQLRAILKYICEAATEGREQQLTEYIIGVDVLHRQPPYRPADDSVVRTRVYELRHKLKRYYEIENPSALIRIEIPKGGYIPRFLPRSLGMPRKSVSRRQWGRGVVITLVLLSFLHSRLFSTPGSPTFEKFGDH